MAGAAATSSSAWPSVIDTLPKATRSQIAIRAIGSPQASGARSFTKSKNARCRQRAEPGPESSPGGAEAPNWVSALWVVQRPPTMPASSAVFSKLSQKSRYLRVGKWASAR